MTARAALAAAANTVTVGGTALNVQPFYRQSAKAGDGWVSLVGLQRDDSGFGFMERWQVTVVLFQDVATAEAWIETNQDQLLAALAPELIVTDLVPAELVMAAGKVPGLVIEGTRPH